MLGNISVSEWMTTPVISVEPNTSLTTAQAIMKETHIRRLPVVKHNHLVGIITLGDIREARPSDATSLSIWELNYLWDQLTVEQAMTKNVITITPQTMILDAARLMLENKIGGMPVVNTQGAIVGILTESDILKLVIQWHIREVSEM